MKTFSLQTVNGVQYRVKDKNLENESKTLNALLYDGYNQNEFETTGTYKNNNPVFTNMSYEKGETYVYIIANNYSGASNGYLYQMDGETQINALEIPSGNDIVSIEWIPQSNYTLDIYVGWSTPGVSGDIICCKKPMLTELTDCMTEEGQNWEDD